MLKASLIPTRLIEPSDREPIPIVEPKRASRMRGLEILAKSLQWAARVLVLRLTRRLTPTVYAVSLRELFEDLGGLWIKFGQLLSLRVDLFSRELCDELGKLVDQTAGFPPDQAVTIIEAELGRPLGEVFQQFDRNPFAAASIGQVHRALLREEQVWVAVKVQRPFIADLFGRELSFVRRVAWLLIRFKVLPTLRWDLMVWELTEVMREEVDYRYEAAAMRRMRRTLKRHRTYVPKLFSTYSTRRVLTSEFIHAVLMGDYIRVHSQDPARIAVWCTENDVQPHTLARRMIFSLFRQIFEDNLYHGDLHPGNIILLRNNRIALIDFGTIGFTETEYLRKFRFYVEALAEMDFARAADLILLLSPALPPLDLEKLKERVVRTYRAWATRARVKNLPYHDRSLNNATAEVVKVLFQEGVTAEWAFLRLRRAMTTLDASLLHLYPSVDFPKLARQYFISAARREVDAIDGRRLIAQGVSGMNKVIAMLGRAEESAMFHGAMIRRHATAFQGATSKFGVFVGELFGGLSKLAMAAGLAGLAIYLRQHHPATIDPWLNAQVADVIDRFPRTSPLQWSIFAVTDAYLMFVWRRLRKRFKRKEFRIPETRVAV